MTDINPKNVDIGSEALSGGLARVALLGVGFLGSIVFARVLGASGFGAFYLLVTLENVIDRPIAGIAESVKKRLSESDSKPAELLGAFFLFFIPFLFLVVALVLLGQSWLNSYVNRSDAYMLFIALFIALAAQDTFNTLLSATGRVGLTNWVDALRSFLTTPLQLGLVFIGLGVVGMTYGLVGASVITATLILYILNIRPTMPSRETLNSVYGYARYSVPSTILSFGYDRIALLLIGFYLGPTIAGYFEATLKLTVPALVIGGMASGALMPKVSDLYSRGEDITTHLRDVLAYSSVFAIPIVFGSAAIAHQLVITVFGSGFAPAAKFLTVIALYRTVNTRASPLNSVLRGIDRPDLDMYSTIGAAVALLGVGLPALWRYGAMGILAGMFCAAGTRYALSAYFVHVEVGNVPHTPRPFLAQLIAGLVMFGAVEWLSQTIGLGSAYTIMFVVGAGAVVYFSVLFLVSRETRTTVLYVLNDFAEDKLGYSIPTVLLP